MTQGHRKAVMYARVSSTKQVKEGDGIASQITRCRVYADQHRCEVVEQFTDDMSGSVLSRPGMKAMISFLKKHKADQVVVIIDDISRLARSLETHIALRLAIKNVGGLLESPSIEFGDSSDSILVENLLASVSQHQRQKNGEQTQHRMVARMMNGYWSFRSPVGLKYLRVEGHGKLLHRDEPIASVIQQAYEGFASGRFCGMAEIMRFIQAQPAWPAKMRKALTIERVRELMSRPLYAGYIEKPEWGIVMQRGKHAPIISLETYLAVQDIIKGKTRIFTRKDVNEDFPLRGYVTCADCGSAYTACWSKGRSARHPYYLCQSKGCTSRGKSIRRDVLESEFDAMLHTLRPTPELFELASEMFRDLWNARMASEQANAKHMRGEVVRVEKQIEQLVDRIVASDVSSISSAFENRVRNLEIEKATLAEKIALCGRPAADFDSTYRTAMEFLANPYKLWVSDSLADKRTLLKLAFAEPIAYARNEGFRTAEAAIPFRIFNALDQLDPEESEMVPLRGFEPLTPALRMRCSTN